MSGMFQGQILKDLGAAQVMLAGQEIYQALEKGVIDAAEFSSPDNDWALGFQEITKVWSVPGWHQAGTAAGILINNRAWDALPKHVQAKIKWAAMANIIWCAAFYNMESGIYAKKFMDKGIKVVYMDDESIAEIEKLSHKHILEEANKNPLFAKVALSIYECLRTLSYYRDKEWPALKRQVPIHLPDMEALRAAAAKYK